MKITDKQLGKRARALTMDADEDRYSGNSYFKATVLRLKDARKSLPYLKHLKECDIEKLWWEQEIEDQPTPACTCGLDAHIVELEQLLGITKDTDKPFTPESK